MHKYLYAVSQTEESFGLGGENRDSKLVKFSCQREPVGVDQLNKLLKYLVNGNGPHKTLKVTIFVIKNYLKINLIKGY